MANRGRPKKIRSQHHATLRAIVADKPLATINELAQAFECQTGIAVHYDTLNKALKDAGITRVRPLASENRHHPEPTGQQRSAYGYGPAHREIVPSQRDATSLTDTEWALVADIFDASGERGKPAVYDRRLLVDACCYVVRTGCAWRMLPADFPPWQNVYRTFRRWAKQGKFEAMHDRLRAQWRSRAGRHVEPTASVIDAQSMRGSPQGGAIGYDAGKKVKDRKRHLVVDTLGLLLAVSVTAASVQDRDGAHPVMAAATAKYPSLQTVFADSGYAGRCAQTIGQQRSLQVEIVRHPHNANAGQWRLPDQPDLFTAGQTAKRFIVLPKRWVVERTHAWVEKARRLVMHHDRRTDVAEAWVWLAQGRMLLNRLSRDNM